MDFHQKLEISDDSKMNIYLCIADLRLPSSGSQSEMVNHVEFNHVLDTIFCGFWTEFVHREMVLVIKKFTLKKYFGFCLS